MIWREPSRRSSSSRPSPSRSSASPTPPRCPRARSSRRSPGCASTTPRATAGSCCARSRAASPLAPPRAPGRAPRALLPRPPPPPLTQAQAECLAIVSYLQPVSRPEIARIRGVASESAVGTLLERGLIDESGRSRFGATLYRTTELFEKLFGLSGLDALPDPSAFDPSPEEEGELRERLLRAGEQRAG